MARYEETKGMLYETRTKIAEHEAKAERYREGMMEGDFEENRVKWANEMVKIKRLEMELRVLENRAYNGGEKMRSEKYLLVKKGLI